MRGAALSDRGVLCAGVMHGAGLSLGGRSPYSRAKHVIRRVSNATNLQLIYTNAFIATSKGTVTIANGGHVEVLDGKTWRIL